MPDLFKNLKSGIKGFKIGIPKQYNIDGIPAEINELWDRGKKNWKV